MWFFRVAVACGARFKSTAMWLANRLKERSTWAAIASAAVFFGWTISGDCTGQEKCITEDMWFKISEVGFYLACAVGVAFKEKKPVQPGQEAEKVADPHPFPEGKNGG